MDRSEPSLVPEWLKSGGSPTGGGSRQQNSITSLRSDDRPGTKHVRNRSSLSSSTQVSDRTTSSYFRRSSSSKGSTPSRSYSSNRSQRDGAWEDLYELQDLGLHKNRDYTDPLGSLLPVKFDKDMLRRSHSMNGRRQEETSRRHGAGELSNARNGNRGIGTSLLTKGSDTNSLHDPAFEQDFPSLGTEERKSDPGTPIPRPSSASSEKNGSDRWTSALAEVPGVVGSSTATSLLSQQTVSGNPSLLGHTANGLKMAEAVAQSPSNARTPATLSVDSQRLEELAIKQSRQLIPMTPSISKSQAPSLLERSKPRPVQPQTKISQSHYGSQPLRGGPARIDVGKASNLGKLQVLKPSGELNGASTVKENLGSPNGVQIPHTSLTVAQSTASSHLKNSVNNQNMAGSERKPAAASLAILEKRPSLQAQSRNDFFNLIKKKSSTNINTGGTDTDRDAFASVLESPEPLNMEAGTVAMDAEIKHECTSASHVSDLPTEDCGKISENGDAFKSSEEHINSLNEEDVAFLRSLGWEEGADDEGLTEDEINAFCEEYMKLRPSSQPLSKAPKIFNLKRNENICNGSLGWSTARSSTQS